MKPSVIIACLLVGAFRPVLLFYDFNPHVEASYQAVAHLLVGGLVGAWIALAPFRAYRVTVVSTVHRLLFAWHDSYAGKEAWQIQAASWLTLVEIMCAVLNASGVRA